MLRTSTPLVPIAGMPAAAALLHRLAADPSAPVTTGVLAPGGHGKTALLGVLREAYAAAGTPVQGPEALRDGGVPDAVVLVDDAHALDEVLVERVATLARCPGARVVVAFRPWPRPRVLTDLAVLLRRSGPLVVLRRLDRAGVDERIAALLQRPARPALGDLVARTTGGNPRLVDDLCRALLHDLPDGAHAASDVLAAGADRVRVHVDALPAGPRDLLAAAAAGAPLDLELLAAVLGHDRGDALDVLEETRATGLLPVDAQVAPVVQRALHGPATTEVRRTVLRVLRERRPASRAAVPVARALAADGVTDDVVADVLRAEGDALLVTEPAQALDLYDAAVAAGLPVTQVAVSRGEAAARTGRLDLALRSVEPVLADRALDGTSTADGRDQRPRDLPADLGRAVRISAMVLASRGLLGRAAEMYRWLGPQRVGAAAPVAVVAFLGTGALEDARAVLDAAPVHGTPSLAAGGEQHLAAGLWRSVTGPAESALSELHRASTLLEATQSPALLPDTPAALTALVAVSAGELDVAEQALDRAIALGAGGPALRSRHLLLRAWVAMLQSRFAQVDELVRSATPDGGVLEPRDELFLRALEVGSARRRSDIAGLVDAWAAARTALLRHPVDLFVLLPLGELAAAAARLRESERLGPHLADAAALLHALGEPPVWATPLHWYGVQAAILEDRPAALEPHATALVRAAATSPSARVLAAAGRVWLSVLAGDVDPEAALAAARGLQAVGLPWDGSRLLGQAAGRCGDRDRKAAAALLHAARSMQAPSPTDAAEGDSADLPAGPALSAREREIAELLLAHRSYREIGAQLFLSPKTVEHHVARMKQRLGVSGRPDLLAALGAHDLVPRGRGAAPRPDVLGRGSPAERDGLVSM